MQPILATLSKRIDALGERNRRVDMDKKWETSMTRRVLIALFIYTALT